MQKGAAASLFAAIKFPERVKGLIMIRPPTAWEERKERRRSLMEVADKCKVKNAESDKGYLVLQGATFSDLPHPDTDKSMYSGIKCPVLILTVKGDATHPLSTAYALTRALPQATLHVAETKELAFSAWPSIIARFMREGL